jgi:hypothetical protein
MIEYARRNVWHMSVVQIGMSVPRVPALGQELCKPHNCQWVASLGTDIPIRTATYDLYYSSNRQAKSNFIKIYTKYT